MLRNIIYTLLSKALALHALPGCESNRSSEQQCQPIDGLEVIHSGLRIQEIPVLDLRDPTTYITDMTEKGTPDWLENQMGIRGDKMNHGDANNGWATGVFIKSIHYPLPPSEAGGSSTPQEAEKQTKDLTPFRWQRTWQP